jgi:ubiquinone/menaquinone biosynthesis C-methylase UbiE
MGMTESGLEPMADFFARRVSEYDRHMLANVEGCREGYAALAAWLPASAEALLDLGVGTGLELTEIYRRFPGLRVTGVDLCRPMLDECARKFAAERPTLVCGDYLSQSYGAAQYDAAVSFETLHHLTESEKRALFRQIHAALRSPGRYVQGDYAARDEAEEAALLAEYRERCRAQGVTPGQRMHLDTPFTAAHECALLRDAGFSSVEAVWRRGNTVLIVADKA